jgi:hypothetical protein
MDLQGKLKLEAQDADGWHYIKMALIKMGFEVMDRIQLTLDRVQ